MKYFTILLTPGRSINRVKKKCHEFSFITNYYTNIYAGTQSSHFKTPGLNKTGIVIHSQDRNSKHPCYLTLKFLSTFIVTNFRG